ncbi:hypothetical protein EYW95_18915, partial [Escherichia coli]|nr:hypothetical protein [Escherichia coli]
MSDTFSEKNNAGELERWFLKIILSKGDQPLPNVADINKNILHINYCLWSKKEYDEQFSVPLKINKIYNLERNTKPYPSEGSFPWTISDETQSWKIQISKEEFENANYLMIWANPIGSAAFFDSDSNYWKGVLRVNISSLGKVVEEENNSNDINHVIMANLSIAQSVISYFLDLVQEFSTNNY